MATFSGTSSESWEAIGTFAVVPTIEAVVGEPVRIFAVSTPTPTLVNGVPQ